MPAVRVSTTAAVQAAAAGTAAARAGSRLAAWLEAHPGESPDGSPLVVSLKLLMRANTGLLKGPLGYRRYPGEKDFGRMAVSAAAALRAYAAGLPAGKGWGEKERQGVSDILYREVRKGALFMPRHGDRPPAQPPLTPEEQEYFAPPGGPGKKEKP